MSIAAGVPSQDVRHRQVAELTAENARLRRYKKRRQMLIQQGKWQPYMDAGPVRAHVLQVMAAASMSTTQYAELAGVSREGIAKLIYGEQPKVLTETGRKLFAVTGTSAPRSGNVNAAGTRRRLQALAVAGWPLRAVAAKAGKSYKSLWRVRDKDGSSVAASTRDAVTRVYRELITKVPPERSREEKMAVTQTRAHARAMGWPGAGKWGDNIDDPQAAATRNCTRRYGNSADTPHETGFSGCTREGAT